MFCTNCGSQMPDGVSFCTKCGTRLAVAARPATPAASPAPAPEPAQGRDRVWPAVLLVVLAVVALAGAGLVAYHTLGPGLPWLTPSEASAEAAGEGEGEAPDAAPAEEEAPDEGAEASDPAANAETDAEPESEPATEAEEPAPTYSSPTFAHVSASSTLGNDGQISYVPENLLDGDVTTGWAEGVSGYGTGEWIELSDEDAQHVTGISLLPGYHKTAELFEMNGCPSRVRVSFSDGGSEEFELSATADSYRVWQTLTFSSPHDTTFVRVEILEVRAGTQWEDTTMTEVMVF